MSSRIKGAFPQTYQDYINMRQPLRLELYEAFVAKEKKSATDAESKKQQVKQLRHTINFANDHHSTLALRHKAS